MGVPRDEQVDRAARAADDVDDRARDPVAAVGAERRGLRAALVQQHDDRPHAMSCAELTCVAIGSLSLVEKIKVANASSGDDVGSALERHADEADLDPIELADRVRREERPARGPVDDVGGQEAKVGTGETIATDAPVGVTAALLHAPQLRVALVELVVADGVEVKPEAVHRLDGRLVVKQRRYQRAGADQVPRGDDQRVLVGRLKTTKVRREKLRAPGGHARSRIRRDLDRPRRRRLQMTMKVVQPKQLNLHRARCGGRRDGKRDKHGQRKDGQAKWLMPSSMAARHHASVIRQ